MIALDARPRLAPKARLRVDEISGKTLLLYPERGLALNETGAEILGLCTGERQVSEIIAALAARHGSHEALADEVRAFLQKLADRNLLRGIEP
ncbi:MAG: pyrroloquinoline quinone biosynthesis peptide chaperone PqqD [Myxococcota bacterium]